VSHHDEQTLHVAAAGVAADKALHQVERSSRLLRALTAATGLAVLLAVVMFGLINNAQQNAARARSLHEQATILAVLHQVQDATNPDSTLSRAAAARGAVTVRALTVCIENHDTRLVEVLARAAVTPLVKGCPADVLPHLPAPAVIPPASTPAVPPQIVATRPVPAPATTTTVLRHREKHR
jgi:hypothetical protein